ncbi:MAG: helix-turn-helix domain-containing protein [Eubacteriales bacterium]|nr:helix-turn-helix domain-containing protein [Eubacteriales bacterium]
MTERNYLSIFRGEPEVMTVSEAAKLLRIGKNKAYALINSGKLSSIKIGGKILVPKLCLIGFLTDEKNYQLSSQFASDSLWTSAKDCDIVSSADGGTGI